MKSTELQDCKAQIDAQMRMFLIHSNLALVILIVCGVVHISMVPSRTRTMAGKRGVYCASPILRETSARSALQCAGECTCDPKCEAYSQRNSQCILHADFCSSADLQAEPGSLYVGECFRFFLHAAILQLGVDVQMSVSCMQTFVAQEIC